LVHLAPALLGRAAAGFYDGKEIPSSTPKSSARRALIEQHGSNVWFEKSAAELWLLVNRRTGKALKRSRNRMTRSSVD